MKEQIHAHLVGLFLPDLSLSLSESFSRFSHEQSTAWSPPAGD